VSTDWTARAVQHTQCAHVCTRTAGGIAQAAGISQLIQLSI